MTAIPLLPLLLLPFLPFLISATDGQEGKEALSLALSKLWQMDAPNRPNFGEVSVMNNNNQMPMINSMDWMAFSQLCSSMDNAANSDSQMAIQNFLHFLNATPIFQEATQFYNGKRANDAPNLIDQVNSLFFTPYNNPPFHRTFCHFSADFANWHSFIRDRNTLNGQLVEVNQNEEDVLIRLEDQEQDGKVLKRQTLVGTGIEFELATIALCALLNGERGQWKHCSAPIGQGKQLLLAVKVETRSNGEDKIGAFFTRIDSSKSNQLEYGKKKPKPRRPNPELQKLVVELWAKDVDRIAPGTITLNWQGHLKKDQVEDISPDPLFSNVNESFLQRPIYAALVEMYNEKPFYPQVCEEEPPMDAGRRAKFTKLWDLIVGSDVYKTAFGYLEKKNKTGGDDFDHFCAKQFDFWFGTYSRCKNRRRLSSSHSSASNADEHRPLGSSGFEHVFSGEWRQPGIVDGHHNWVRFYLQEKAGDINYHGYFGHQKDDIIGTFQYKWNGFLKRIGGFFFQTSPAFDFSLFTVCALTQPGDEGCQFELLNSELFVTSFIQPCQNGKCVATTYPGSWYNTTVVN